MRPGHGLVRQGQHLPTPDLLEIGQDTNRPILGRWRGQILVQDAVGAMSTLGMRWRIGIGVICHQLHARAHRRAHLNPDAPLSSQHGRHGGRDRGKTDRHEHGPDQSAVVNVQSHEGIQNALEDMTNQGRGT
jgi:hypothetical protein